MVLIGQVRLFHQVSLKICADAMSSGVLHEYEKDCKLPPDKRYIHCVIMLGDVKIAVTMLPRIVKHIHTCRFLAIDFTFKRIEGETNEWEVASNLDRHHMRMLISLCMSL